MDVIAVLSSPLDKKRQFSLNLLDTQCKLQQDGDGRCTASPGL